MESHSARLQRNFDGSYCTVPYSAPIGHFAPHSHPGEAVSYREHLAILGAYVESTKLPAISETRQSQPFGVGGCQSLVGGDSTIAKRVSLWTRRRGNSDACPTGLCTLHQQQARYYQTRQSWDG